MERIAGGFGFVEGPVWDARGNRLLFSDMPRDRIVQWSEREGVGVFREPSGQSNGLALDRDGLLVACEHRNRRVSRTRSDGTVVTIADRFEGKPLNSPNDLAIAPDGSIYFTDPPYGLPDLEAGRALDFNGVFRIAPSGALTLLARDFERPNGLAFSPDGRTLYIADTARLHVRAFTVRADGMLDAGRVFGEMKPPDDVEGRPDGVKVDPEGRVYIAAAGGVWVLDASGRHLGIIETPERPSNLAFGDADVRSLYITARTSLYRVRLFAACG